MFHENESFSVLKRELIYENFHSKTWPCLFTKTSFFIHIITELFSVKQIPTSHTRVLNENCINDSLWEFSYENVPLFVYVNDFFRNNVNLGWTNTDKSFSVWKREFSLILLSVKNKFRFEQTRCAHLHKKILVTNKLT